MKFFLLACNLLFFQYCFATVDTIIIPSKAMNKSINAIVITPKKYKKRNHYPVTYLLHGYGGNYSNWIKKAPFLQELSTLYNMIIVCPDGAVGSWYIDSPYIGRAHV